MSPVCPTDRPLPLSKLLVGLFVLAICGIYVLTTLLYVSPSNPLRIQFDAELDAFENWAYQKWTFFAPPPKHNDRLYFAFSPTSGDGITFEILEGIAKRKQLDNPRNLKAVVVDYAVSGAARQVSDIIREVYRYREVHELMDGDPAYLDDLAKTSLNPDLPSGINVRFLLRYAAMIAVEQGIELEGLKCQMALTRVPMRPFMQRNNNEFPIEEKLVYKTSLLDVSKLLNR